VVICFALCVQVFTFMEVVELWVHGKFICLSSLLLALQDGLRSFAMVGSMDSVMIGKCCKLGL
jgi:hypothetical protein